MIRPRSEVRPTRGAVPRGLARVAILAAAMLCATGCRHASERESFAKLYRVKAEAKLDRGDTVEAAMALSRAERLDPKSADTQLLIGEVFRREGHPDEAEARYRRALKLRPEFPEAHNNLGVIQAGRRNWDEAIREFRLAAENEKYGQRDRAYNNLGRAYVEKKDLAAAGKAFRSAIALNSRLPESYVNLGRVLSTRGDLDGGAAALRSAIRLDPRAAEPRYQLAVVLIRMGRREQAIVELRSVVQLDPSGSLAEEAHRQLSILE